MKTGVQIISEERARHFMQENWTAKHDDAHAKGELAVAAACYALTQYEIRRSTVCHHGVPRDRFTTIIDHLWPFEREWWKPTPRNRVKQLAKAGALIAAEIDRLQRLKP